MDMPFPHWGEVLSTRSLPWSYLPEQWLARLPEAFLVLLAIAALFGLANSVGFAATAWDRFRRHGTAGLRGPALLLARQRGRLVVWTAVIVPVGYLMTRQATLYDGIRHTLFVIPMLALLAGWAFVRLVPVLRRILIPAVAVSAAYLVAVIVNLALLHPLEYVATNAFAGGTRGSYGRFELDYWAAAATEALRRLERRLDVAGSFARDPPSLTICIRYREAMAGTLLRKPWRLETDPAQADFVIETERSRCAANMEGVVLIDQVRRLDQPFAWIYANERRR